MSNEYKNKFYRTANRNATERKLAVILFRTYKKNPAEAYGILQDLSKASEEDKQRLLKYVDKLHQRRNIIHFVGFYMLLRVTLPNNPRLKNIYWQNNLSLLYPELPQKEARLKAMRTAKRQEKEDQIDEEAPETTVQTHEEIVQTHDNIFQSLIGHIKEKFEHLK